MQHRYEGCSGNNCIMTWEEHSIVKATNRPIDGFINWSNYYFNSQVGVRVGRTL